MKILYGIQGTGNGHITRARILNTAFKQHKDIHVDYVFSGRDASQYFDMQAFNQYQTFKGLSFVCNEGKISKRKTIQQLDFITFLQDLRKLDLSHYDLVLNDFEPLTAWAARQKGLPSISISHQSAYQLDVPKEGNGLIERFIMSFFAPTRYSLGVHWYHYGQSIMPPFVEQSSALVDTRYKTQAITPGRFILVYLPFEKLRLIEQELSSLSEYQFVCFHPDVKHESSTKNIKWCPPSREGFLAHLQACEKVIGNGGFELATECMSLGKAILIKPLKGQFEQLSNAKALFEMGVAHIVHELQTEQIEEWLEASKGQKIDFSSNPHVFIDWLKTKKWNNTQAICDKLWKDVNYPEPVRNRLQA